MSITLKHYKSSGKGKALLSTAFNKIQKALKYWYRESQEKSGVCMLANPRLLLWYL